MMNQTGRRIAAWAASLLLTASTAGLLFTTALAAELPEDPEPTVTEGSTSPTPEESTTPDTAGGSHTDPEIPPTGGEDTEGTTTSQDEGTDPTVPAVTTSDTSGTGTTTPSTGEDGTQPTTGTTVTTVATVTEAPGTTTEATTTTKATVAPSRDPVISAGVAWSEGPIPLSTENDGRPADTSGSRPGQVSGSQPGVSRETGGAQNSSESHSGDVGETNPVNDGSGVRQISIICSIFALLSGAVLVLLKFIR